MPTVHTRIIPVCCTRRLRVFFFFIGPTYLCASRVQHTSCRTDFRNPVLLCIIPTYNSRPGGRLYFRRYTILGIIIYVPNAVKPAYYIIRPEIRGISVTVVDVHIIGKILGQTMIFIAISFISFFQGEQVPRVKNQVSVSQMSARYAGGPVFERCLTSIIILNTIATAT